MPAPSPAPVAPNAPKPDAKPDPKAKGKGKPKGKGGRKVLLIVVAVLVLAGSGGGWWWWQHQQAADAEAHKKTPATKARAQAQYFALEPAFVVNLTDEETIRYLQADVQLMTRDGATLEAFTSQAPAIRNRLLLLFGQQSAAQLAQRSGKERLQESALTEVRRLLKSEGAPDKIEAVIFTSLVTQ